MPARTSTKPLLALLAVLGLAGTVACSISLNPQPLPPVDDQKNEDAPGATGGEARPSTPSADAGAPPPMPADAGNFGDAAPPQGDAGADAMVDGGDAGTVSSDSGTD